MSRLLYQLSYGPLPYEMPLYAKPPGLSRRCGCISMSLQALSTKLRSILLRLGCRSLRSALASIWRTRSRVTSKSWPTSSKRMRRVHTDPKTLTQDPLFPWCERL